MLFYWELLWFEQVHRLALCRSWTLLWFDLSTWLWKQSASWTPSLFSISQSQTQSNNPWVSLNPISCLTMSFCSMTPSKLIMNPSCLFAGEVTISLCDVICRSSSPKRNYSFLHTKRTHALLSKNCMKSKQWLALLFPHFDVLVDS